MIVRKFIVEKHEEYGHLGLQPLWLPADVFEPTETPAHDVLEHTPTYQGGWHDEWMALGATLFVRGPWWPMDAGNLNRAEVHIGSDIAFFHRDDEGRRGPFAPVHAIPRRIADSEVAEIIRKGTTTEYLKHWNDTDSDGTPLTEWERENVRRWACYGYQQARARYQGVSPGYHLFQKINDAAKHCCDNEGQRWTLRVDLATGHVAFNEDAESSWE